MLVLTRRVAETIVIADNIRVTIVSVGPGRVKIGIDAPADVRIDREEVHSRIAGEQPAAPTPVEADEPILAGEAAPKIHNRIADRLPAIAAAEAAPAPRGPFRAPRKPR